MGLEAILAAIRITGQDQVVQIETAAQTQVDEILEHANNEAIHIRDQSCIEATAPAYRERSRIIQSARLAAMQIIGDAREELIQEVLDQVRERLAEFRSDPIYPQVLKELLQQSLAELESGYGDIQRATIEINQLDLDLMNNILGEIKLDLPIHTDLQIWGGLIVKSQGAKVVVINTLEARLESAIPYLRLSLAAFFDNQECLVSTTVTRVYER